MNVYLIEYYDKGSNIRTVTYIRAISKDAAVKKFF